MDEEVDSARAKVRDLLEKMDASQITATGEGFMCACPLPDHEDDTPSFAINAETGLWRCYGCKERGNLPMLVSIVFGIELEEAQRKYNVDALELRRMPPPLPDYNERHTSGHVVLDERTVAPYLRICPRYMLSRGFDKAFLREYEVGYDPAAMAVVFPIRDVHGKLVGVTRRTTLPDVKPKYMHLPKKIAASKHMYLGHRFDAFQRKGAVVVVEGHVDALKMEFICREGGAVERGLREAGVPFAHAAATMGGGVSRAQARLLVRRFRQIVLAMDNDKPGWEYMWGSKKAREREEKRRTKGHAPKPLGSVEVLLAEGAMELYALDYECSDPGDLSADDTIDVVALS